MTPNPLDGRCAKFVSPEIKEGIPRNQGGQEWEKFIKRELVRGKGVPTSGPPSRGNLHCECGHNAGPTIISQQDYKRSC